MHVLQLQQPVQLVFGRSLVVRQVRGAQHEPSPLPGLRNGMEGRWAKKKKGKKRNTAHNHESLAPSWQWHHMYVLHRNVPCAFHPSSRDIPHGCRCRQQRVEHRPYATRQCPPRRLQSLRPSFVVPRWPRVVVAQSSMRCGLETSLNPSPIRCQIRRLVRRHSAVAPPKGICFVLFFDKDYRQ